MYVKIEVIFHFSKQFRSSSIWPNNDLVFHLKTILKYLYHFPHNLKLRSSSISPKVEVVFQFGSYCTHIKLGGPYSWKLWANINKVALKLCHFPGGNLECQEEYKTLQTVIHNGCFYLKLNIFSQYVWYVYFLKLCLLTHLLIYGPLAPGQISPV